MNPLTLRRLSGGAAVAAGPLCIIGGLLHPIDDGHAHNAASLASSHAFGSIALLLGTVLLLVGLPGVYGWLAPKLGTLGLIGYLLLPTAPPRLSATGPRARAPSHPAWATPPWCRRCRAGTCGETGASS